MAIQALAPLTAKEIGTYEIVKRLFCCNLTDHIRPNMVEPAFMASRRFGDEKLKEFLFPKMIEVLRARRGMPRAYKAES